MNIYEIKSRVVNAPHFFDRQSMRFFGQTMKSFSVTKADDGKFLISAPMRDHSGKVQGTTRRLFNPVTNELEFIA